MFWFFEKRHLLNIWSWPGALNSNKYGTFKIKRIAHSPIADFVLSKHGLKRDPSLFPENEVSHCTVYNNVKVVLLSWNKALLKKACFRKFYKPKIHLETAQKLPFSWLSQQRVFRN